MDLNTLAQDISVCSKPKLSAISAILSSESFILSTPKHAAIYGGSAQEKVLLERIAAILSMLQSEYGHAFIRSLLAAFLATLSESEVNQIVQSLESIRALEKGYTKEEEETA